MRLAFLYYFSVFFFFNDTATTEIYTLSLHDALPILSPHGWRGRDAESVQHARPRLEGRSEEHTSELQSLQHLVCRLLLEKKKHMPDRTHSRKLRATDTGLVDTGRSV